MTFNSNTSKLRKFLVAVVATAVVGTTMLTPTMASAGWHGGWGHGGWHGGGWHGGGFGGGLGIGLGVGLLTAAIANSAAQQQSCMQTQYVQLKNGLYKQVTVNACCNKRSPTSKKWRRGRRHFSFPALRLRRWCRREAAGRGPRT